MPTDPPKYYGLDDTNGSGTFDRGDDLKPKLKKTLGDYLSELTRTSPTDNKYTIAPGTSEHVTFTDDNGHPSPLVTGQGSGDEVFIDQVAESAKAYFEKVSNSGVFDSAEPTDKFLVDLINKRIQEDGHELLSSIKGTALDDAGNTVTPGEPKTLIEQKIHGVLLNNRFNPSGQSPYVQDGQFSGAFGQKQRKFGKYDEIAKVSYEVEDLTKIACSLLLKSSGRLTEKEDPGEYDSGNILTVGAGSGGSLGPLSTVRIGTKKLGPGDLYAENAYGGAKLTTAGLTSTELRETAGPDGEKAQADGFNVPGSSFGQMWSHLEQFAPSGPYSASPIALLLPQFAVIATITAVIGLLVGLLTPGAGLGIKKKTESSEPAKDAQMKKGAHEPLKKPMAHSLSPFGFIRKALAIPETKNPYTSSVFVGLLWFQTSAVWGGAGFVANAQRGVARDVVEFGSGIGEKFSGGFISDLQGIGILIHELTTSKAFRFVQVMAVMGDKVLTQWRSGKKYFTTTEAGLGVADLDKMPNTIEVDGITYTWSRQMKSREGPMDRRLVWRNSSVNSKYLFPVSLAGAMQDLKFSIKDAFVPGNPKSGLTDQLKMTTMSQKISADDVKKIEDSLDAEYVPFYFHDLRTNEIIAFHAFLSNITDQYSPQWTEVGGIGRVEPVQIYGSTKRSISLEFFAAATNKDDFDDMWFKINKLLTLVYPQWSRGRFVNQGDTKFIQPFSNVKTASPIVRIRLGDLLKSNYSRFALARLFGVTEAEFTIKDSSRKASDDEIQAVIDNKEFISIISELNYNPGTEVTIKGGNTYKVAIPAGALGGAAPLPPDEITIPEDMVAEILFTLPNITISDGPEGSTLAGQAAARTNPETAGTSTDIESASVGRMYSVIIKSQDNVWLKQFEGLEIDVSQEHIQLSDAQSLELARQLALLPPILLPDEFPENFREFMSPENNAIVRSFESTRGRGLAGAITGLDFTWNDMPWEHVKGSRAPKMCKINIQFSPIHDIQPGIDYNGFNRAPVYNVGTIMNGIAFDPYDGDEGG